MRLIESFAEGYERIKENCERYSGLEAAGVSRLYEKFSWVHNMGIVVLDIEAALIEGKKQNRIDLVLYDTENRLIRFFEAKHFSNLELHSLEVVDQLTRYREQLEKRTAEIHTAYCRYIDAARELFDVDLPEPVTIDPEPRLLIFGYDGSQKKDRLKSLRTALKQKNVAFHCNGDTRTVKIANVFKNMH